MNTGGFQTQAYNSPAFAVAGDFASQNPFFSFDAGPGGLVAGPGGVSVGRFAWVYPPDDPDGTPTQALNTGVGNVAGFVHRAMQASIITYLANAGQVILQGQMVSLHTGGDYWVVNDGTTEAVPGNKAYAFFANGKVSFGATGTPTQNATSSASTITAGTASITGSISGDLLTVTAVGSGVLYNGSTLTGTAGVATGTKIISQVSGSVGGTGVYLVSIDEQTVPSGTITTTYGLLTIGGSLTGAFGFGDVVTGTGVVSGTKITQLGSGNGGAGTYIVDGTQAMSSSAVNSNGNVETKWIAMSAGNAGDLVKISDHATG
jgi:hypothetical protein